LNRCSLDLILNDCHEPPQQNDLLFWATIYLLAALAAATILSKRFINTAWCQSREEPVRTQRAFSAANS
jgi:hypothetical protein